MRLLYGSMFCETNQNKALQSKATSMVIDEGQDKGHAKLASRSRQGFKDSICATSAETNYLLGYSM